MTGIRVFVLVLVGCVVFAVVAGRYLAGAFGERVADAGSSLFEDAVKASQDAKAFAATHAQHECADAALDRVKDCVSVFCKSNGVVFMTECLERAERSAALCHEVPETWLGRWGWPRRHCSARDADPQSCQAIFKMVADYCGGARPSRPPFAESQTLR